MTNRQERCNQAGDRPALEIEITPTMIEAGVLELRGRAFGEPLARIVEDLWLAMEAAR